MAKQKRKQSVLGLFFSFFLKAVVIILGLVILAMGAYLIRAYFYMKGNETDAVVDENAFEDDQQDELLTAETVSADDLLFETASEEETSEVIYIPYETSIAVINATDTAGLAAAWKAKLKTVSSSSVPKNSKRSSKRERSIRIRCLVMQRENWATMVLWT